MTNELSESTLGLVGGLTDPVRLRVLLALEEEPRTATQLARALDVPYDKVNWIVKRLEKAGLADLRSVEPAAGGMVMQKVYAARHRGWAELVPLFEAIAGSAR
jgi:DNA-binding transcriptional ArsR family regulator